MITIGITGGIGSGKSIVSSLLQVYGVPVYSADLESKRLLVSSDALREQLTALLGTQIYTDKGLNRSLMATMIFSDKQLLEKVNALVHPEVDRDFSKWKEQLPTDFCAMETAILFEAGFDHKMDVRLMVYAPEKTRISRVMERDRVLEAAVKLRMEQQWSDEDKVKLCDWVIENNGEAALIPQVEKFMTFLHNKCK